MKKVTINIETEIDNEELQQINDALAVILENMKLRGVVEIEGKATIFPISSQLLAYIGVMSHERGLKDA